MKSFLTTILILLVFNPTNFFSQRIGEVVPPEPPIDFPSKASGISFNFSDNGFGFGGFYTSSFSRNLTGITELTISELKSERELERYDYWGRPYVLNKVNRIFALPFTLGIKYRLFTDELAENLRPYILAEVGPTLIIATKYHPDFFLSLTNPKYYKAVIGVLGFGGNFGLSTTNLLGLSFRFRYIHLLETQGVETLKGIFKKDFAVFSLSLNIGWMFN